MSSTQDTGFSTAQLRLLLDTVKHQLKTQTEYREVGLYRRPASLQRRTRLRTEHAHTRTHAPTNHTSMPPSPLPHHAPTTRTTRPAQLLDSGLSP